MLLYRSLRAFCRQAIPLGNIPPTKVSWFRFNDVYWLKMKNIDEIIIPVQPHNTFQDIIKSNNKFELEILFPPGMDKSSNIIEFLLDESEPKKIQLEFNQKKYYIQNRASSQYFQAFRRVITDPNNIHNIKEQNIKKYGLTPQVTSVLTYYQLILNSELKKLPQDSVVTEEKKHQIMMKIMGYFRHQNAQKIHNYKLEELRLDKIIYTLEKQIFQIQSDNEFSYRMYKNIIIVLSIIHIVSFSHMIWIEADWLGWDIVQPLTYSVGLFGTILAMRFFLKHRRDRSNEAIKDTLLNWIIKPTDKVRLADLKRKRDLYLQERQRIQNKLSTLNMRNDYGYFRDMQQIANTPPKDIDE